MNHHHTLILDQSGFQRTEMYANFLNRWKIVNLQRNILREASLDALFAGSSWLRSNLRTDQWAYLESRWMILKLPQSNHQYLLRKNIVCEYLFIKSCSLIQYRIKFCHLKRALEMFQQWQIGAQVYNARLTNLWLSGHVIPCKRKKRWRHYFGCHACCWIFWVRLRFGDCRVASHSEMLLKLFGKVLRPLIASRCWGILSINHCRYWRKLSPI